MGRWIEQFLPLDLQRTPIDFSQAMDQLEGFLEVTVAADDGVALQGLLDTLAIDGVTAGDDRVTVTLAMDALPVSTPPRAAEPVLTDEELARLEAQLDAVYAFFTYTIKCVAGGAGEPDTARLLEVLIELRRGLVAVLTQQQSPNADPARTLFVEAWDGLVSAFRLVSARMPDHEGAMRHLTSIGGGKVLRPLDELGPAGIEVSSDGLRRLARILVPSDAGDPLERDYAVDPELSRSLGMGEPLPPPGDYRDNTSWLDWLSPRSVAADTLAPSVVERLNTRVPGPRDM